MARRAFDFRRPVERARGAHDFIAALLEGRQPAQGYVDAADTLRFPLAAHVSACEHREVRLDEIGPDTRAPLPNDRSGDTHAWHRSGGQSGCCWVTQ